MQRKVDLLKSDGFAALVGLREIARLVVDNVNVVPPSEERVVEVRFEDARFEGWDDVTVRSEVQGWPVQRLVQAKRQSTPLKSEQMRELLVNLHGAGPVCGSLILRDLVSVKEAGELRDLRELCERLQGKQIDAEAFTSTLTKAQACWLDWTSQALGLAGPGQAIEFLKRLSIETTSADSLRELVELRLAQVTGQPKQLADRLRAFCADTIDSAASLSWDILRAEVEPYLAAPISQPLNRRLGLPGTNPAKGTEEWFELQRILGMLRLAGIGHIGAFEAMLRVFPTVTMEWLAELENAMLIQPSMGRRRSYCATGKAMRLYSLNKWVVLAARFDPTGEAMRILESTHGMLEFQTRYGDFTPWFEQIPLLSPGQHGVFFIGANAWD